MRGQPPFNSNTCFCLTASIGSLYFLLLIDFAVRAMTPPDRTGTAAFFLLPVQLYGLAGRHDAGRWIEVDGLQLLALVASSRSLPAFLDPGMVVRWPPPFNTQPNRPAVRQQQLLLCRALYLAFSFLSLAHRDAAKDVSAQLTCQRSISYRRPTREHTTATTPSTSRSGL